MQNWHEIGKMTAWRSVTTHQIMRLSSRGVVGLLLGIKPRECPEFDFLVVWVPTLCNANLHMATRRRTLCIKKERCF
jgi:hypothetical protein